MEIGSWASGIWPRLDARMRSRKVGRRSRDASNLTCLAGKTHCTTCETNTNRTPRASSRGSARSPRGFVTNHYGYDGVVVFACLNHRKKKSRRVSKRRIIHYEVADVWDPAFRHSFRLGACGVRSEVSILALKHSTSCFRATTADWLRR